MAEGDQGDSKGSLSPVPPRRTVERIRVLRDVGITQIGLLVDFGSLPQTEIMRSLRVFADQVLPHVRDL